MVDGSCSEENSYLISTTPPVEVDKLSIVLFSNCCLEQTLMTTDVTLALPADLRPPNSEHRASVRSVLDEFRRENLDNYYFNASKDGMFPPTNLEGFCSEIKAQSLLCLEIAGRNY